MANTLKNENAIRTVMLFLHGRGMDVNWSGLCIWASNGGKKYRKGSEMDKVLATIGASWSQKRKAYFMRADGNEFELPKKGSITVESITGAEGKVA